jgi:archaetidylinositol phosphate synthase
VDGYQDPERVQLSILTKLEKKTLRWLAMHMPVWVNSDHLTILGFAGMILAGVTYAFTPYYRYGPLLATFFLAVNWFGDSLDGTLARLRNKQRPRYGFYVDHVVDMFGMLFLFGGIGISGLMNAKIAVGLLLVYYMLSIEIYLATHTIGKFVLSFGIFGPTELRVLLSIGNVVVLFHPTVHVFGKQYLLFDVGCFVGIIGILAMLIYSSIKNTIFLYKSERL